MKKTILLFLLFSALLSCNSDVFNKPSKYHIISDLIGQEVLGWRFLNNEEFKTFDIISTRIIDSDPFSYSDDKLEYYIKGTYYDYSRNEEYNGVITVFYKLNDKLEWVFNEVTGEIRPSENTKKEKRKKKSDEFSINYELELKIEKQQCPNCSHIDVVEKINSFPDISFEDYDNENEMQTLWEEHKKQIRDNYINAWGVFASCNQCHKASYNDFNTVDISYSKINKTFRRP